MLCVEVHLLLFSQLEVEEVFVQGFASLFVDAFHRGEDEVIAAVAHVRLFRFKLVQSLITVVIERTLVFRAAIVNFKSDVLIDSWILVAKNPWPRL